MGKLFRGHNQPLSSRPWFWLTSHWMCACDGRVCKMSEVQHICGHWQELQHSARQGRKMSAARLETLWLSASEAKFKRIKKAKAKSHQWKFVSLMEITSSSIHPTVGPTTRAIIRLLRVCVLNKDYFFLVTSAFCLLLLGVDWFVICWVVKVPLETVRCNGYK